MNQPLRVGSAPSARVELAISDAEIRASRMTSQMGTAIGDLQRGRGSLEAAEALLNESSEVLAELTREGRAGAAIDRLDALRGTLATTIQSARRDRAIGAVAERRGASEGASIARDVRLAAQTMRRTGDPSAFAGALVRGGSDARMRELSRVSESDLRAALANAGVTGEAADRAIDALKSNIALPFQRRVHEQGARRLDQAAARLERAAVGMGPEHAEQLARLQGPRGEELLATLRLVGAEDQATELAGLLARGADAEQLRLPLARAMRTLADAVRERATDVARGEGHAALSASPSREMPWADAEVQQRWGAGGIVEQAIREHTEAANAERASDATIGKYVLIAAGLLMGMVGAVGASVVASAGREGAEVASFYGDADDAAADAAAQLGTVERAQTTERRAEVGARFAVAAVAAEGLLAFGGAKMHGPDAGPSLGLVTAETAGSIGIEAGKHELERRVLEED
jgi:hypothetical protein